MCSSPVDVDNTSFIYINVHIGHKEFISATVRRASCCDAKNLAGAFGSQASTGGLNIKVA
jgi:hypothetical protein